MRVLVTGVTGFLGSHIAERLLREGHEVSALVRDPVRLDADLRGWLAGTEESGPRRPPTATEIPAGSGAPGPPPPPGRLRLFRGSLADARSLADALEGTDAVVHVAGLIQARDEAGFMRVNRDGTEALLREVEAGGGTPRRFVLISSQAAGGPALDGRPVTGGDPPHPVSAYGRSKLAGEMRALARADRFPVTVLRPPVIFGPRDRMLGPLFAAVRRGVMPVWSDGENAFNVVYGPDVGDAVMRCLDQNHPSGSILYTADERVFTWKSFATAMARTIGTRVRFWRIPPVLFATAAGASNALSWVTGGAPFFSLDKILELRERAWLCSSAETQRLIGWVPSTPVEEGLAATFAWYQRHRPS